MPADATYSPGDGVTYAGPDAWLADPSLSPGSAGTVTGHVTGKNASVTPNVYTITWDLGASTGPADAISVLAADAAAFAYIRASPS